MPKLTPQLCRIMCLQKNPACDEFDPVVYFGHTYNLAELRIVGDYTRNEVHVYDMAGFRLSHFTKVTPMVIRRAACILDVSISSEVL